MKAVRSSMRVSEIRVGIKFNNLGNIEPFTVLDISDGTKRGEVHFDMADQRERYSHIISCVESTKKFWPLEMTGIPISPEWLIRAGFTDHTADDTWSNPANNHHVVLKNGVWIYRVPGLSLRELEFVHELQNLFFALTGTELIFAA